MVARVARFEGMDIAKAQETMGEAEGIIRPIVEGMQGFAGRMDLAGNGEFISITLFDSAEDAAAAEQTFDEEMPKKLGHLYQSWGGRRAATGVFEVVSDVRK
ncbi:MAG TPA: hypothetical protein VFJ93_03555 [Gaiellaceae bacterium]|nr:hypothetical protein [Gaiellaceae bacterium]